MKVAAWAALIWIACVPGPVLADDAADLLGAMVSRCLTGLEGGRDPAEGLERAAPEMEAKLLDGKQAQVFRTANQRVVLVAHEGGTTCEVMGLGIVIADFAAQLDAWLDLDRNYVIDATAEMSADGPGGAALARAMPEGGFMQVFIQTQPVGGFVGITASRVADSQMARDMLGL